MTAVLLTGCAVDSGPAPGAVPDDLCTALDDPAALTLVPDEGSRVRPFVWRSENENRVQCRVAATGGPNLEIDFRRYGGGTPPRRPDLSPEGRADTAFRGIRTEHTQIWKCSFTPVKVARGTGELCEQPAGRAGMRGAFVSVLVRADRDFAVASLSGGQDLDRTRAVLLRHIDEMLTRM
ncbi:hypothetical protein [Streptomyces sp. NPDC005805]|uniref:hypothetical protein n=1 Tax=Streptomyces sp. NPDC005805 TaxID=3157068 RepID=UPI00340C5E77